MAGSCKRGTETSGAIKSGDFLTSLLPVSSLGRILLRGVRPLVNSVR